MLNGICSIYVCLSRSTTTWQPVLQFQRQIEGSERVVFANMESRYLTQSSAFDNQERISHFHEETRPIPSDLVPRYQVQFMDPINSGSFVVLESRFSIQAQKPSPIYNSSKVVRIAATAKLRKAALKANQPTSIQELATLVSTARF